MKEIMYEFQYAMIALFWACSQEHGFDWQNTKSFHCLVFAVGSPSAAQSNEHIQPVTDTSYYSEAEPVQRKSAPNKSDKYVSSISLYRLQLFIISRSIKPAVAYKV